MSWWDASWLYRKKLTFDNSGQAENLASFPVLVKLTTANFDFSKALATGYDIRFVDADDTTELKYEREKWTANTEAWIWVKVPQIDASSATDFIYIYYGNAAAGDGQDKNNAWDANFQAVWHFNEASGNLLDSTVNARHGAVSGCTRGQVGQIGDAYYFDQLDDQIIAPGAWFTYGYTDNFTVEIYLKSDLTPAAGTYPTALIKRSTGTQPNPISLNQFDGTNRLDMWTGGSSGSWGGTVLATFNNNVWHYIVMRHLSTSYFEGYADGALTLTSGTETQDISNTLDIAIGNFPQLARWWKNYIDEIRISNIARSALWIKAQYLSMTIAFITFGSEEEGITAKTSSDTGTGVDGVVSGNPLVILVKAETGSGVDVLVEAEVILQGTDSGLGSDLSALLVTLLGADTGVGVDAVVALLEIIEKFGSDSGVGVDALVGLLGVLLGSDGGVGVESLLDRLLGLADVGVGVDAVVALVTPPGFEPRQSAYDGYRCFMEQYVKNKLLGSLPWKLPDGTKW